MRKIIQLLAIAGVAAIIPSLSSCNNDDSKKGTETKIDRTHVKSERAGINEVIVYIPGDIDKLNPVTYTSAYGGYANGNIFMQLEDVDKDSFQIFPSLVKARPDIKLIDEGEYKGGMSLMYELRPEATWDNGTPVTADDIAFTMKAYKNPNVDAESQRPYLEFIDDVVIDPQNNRKFTYMCKGRYFLSEYSAGLSPVIPEYVYDAGK